MGFLSKLLDRFTGGNVLYYPGCLTKFANPDILKNYKVLLQRAGVDYVTLPDLELCCGSPAINAGYEDDFVDLARKNLEIFRDHGVKKIVTNCPGCFLIFNSLYPKYLSDWDIEVEHATVFLENLHRQKKLPLADIGKGRKLTFHDPCHLGRHSGIYDPPRYLLEAIGFNVVEMRRSKDKALCCGAGAGMRNNFKDTAKEVAKIRVLEAKETEAEILTSCCSMCAMHLDENSGQGPKVMELSELLVEALR